MSRVMDKVVEIANKREEVNLSKEQITLGAIDEIDAQVKKSIAEIKPTRALLRKAESSLGDNLKKLNGLDSDFKQIDSMVKLLGLDTPPEVEKNRKIVNEFKTAIKRALGSLGGAISSI